MKKNLYSQKFKIGLLLSSAAVLLITPSCKQAEAETESLPSNPNVLFIAIEDFNPEHFGCYGGKAITPNIDALAGDGVAFTNAYCQVAVCNPSRAALLTGLEPPSSGVFGNSDQWKDLILPNIPVTMPQNFMQNGYDAVKIGKLYHYQMEHPESWSRVLPENVEGRKILSAWSKADVIPLLEELEGFEGGGWFAKNLHWGPVDCEPEEFRDGHYATNASNYLAEEHDKPFFFAIGFHAPHVKFAAPRQFFDIYDVNDIILPDNPENDLADMPAIESKNVIHQVLDTLKWKEIKRAQFACISYVDWCIGQLMESIRKNKLEDNTIIVLWTDHGFMLGEHFQWSKAGNKLFNETTKVGMIWKVPGLTPAGKISERVVETIDIFPTLFELCNLPTPDHVEGSSFAELLKDPDMIWDNYAVTWGTRNRLSVQTERYRFNTDLDLDPSSFELFDQKYDPDEYINLSCNPQYQDVIEMMIENFEEYREKYLLDNPF